MIYAVSHGRDGLHDLWPALYTRRGERDAPGRRDDPHRSDARRFRMAVLLLRLSKAGARARAGIWRRQDAHRPMRSAHSTAGRLSGALVADVDAVLHGEDVSGRVSAAARSSPSTARRIARRSPQEGYQVVFQQFKDGLAADYTVFASGFAGGMDEPRRRRASPGRSRAGSRRRALSERRQGRPNLEDYV